MGTRPEVFANIETTDEGSSGVRIEKADDALTVTIDGKLFTRYIYKGAPKPYCWPVIGPTGDPITRAYPMEKVPGEKEDHPHQRSLWFTHGLVNGIDFWSETVKDGREMHGRQVHRKFETVAGGPKMGRIRAVNDWLAPDGQKVCEDSRELTFYAAKGEARVMDFDISISATEGPVTFGDTKEGMFGIRVATSMDVEQKDKSVKGGHIVNSRGDTDDKAWGKPAEWVDYSGPVNGKTVGITIMNHPVSFRYPTHWHVRTYGLFAPNPFGLHDFYNDKSKDGSWTIPKGESISFRYRMLFHLGNAAAAKPAEAYAEYAQLVNLPDDADIESMTAKVLDPIFLKRLAPAEVEFSVPNEYVPKILGAFRPAVKYDYFASWDLHPLGCLKVMTTTGQVTRITYPWTGQLPICFTVDGVRCSRGGIYHPVIVGTKLKDALWIDESTTLFEALRYIGKELKSGEKHAHEIVDSKFEDLERSAGKLAPEVGEHH